MQQACIRDGMLGAKRSFSGAKARLCNDADRPKAGLMYVEDLFCMSLALRSSPGKSPAV
jgi:hypothetical protein